MERRYNPSLENHNSSFSDYQMLKTVVVSLTDHKSRDQYKRSLYIGNVISTVEYRSNGVLYEREYLSTHVADVLVAHLTADKQRSYTGSVFLNDSHEGQTMISNNTIVVSGSLHN